MSPLTLVARISATGLARSSPLGSRSETASPDVEDRSNQMRRPVARPLSMSPDTDRSCRSLSAARSRRSPEADEACPLPSRLSTWKVSDAVRAVREPATDPNVMSPDEVVATTSPPTRSARTSPFAVFATTAPETDAARRSPDPDRNARVFRARRRRRGRLSRSRPRRRCGSEPRCRRGARCHGTTRTPIPCDARRPVVFPRLRMRSPRS